MDSLRGIAASLNRALGGSGLPIHPDSAVRGFIGNGSRALIQRAAPSAADEALLLEIEQAFKADYDLTWPDGTTVYAGIFELLESLQACGHPLAVLSNKPHPFTAAIVSRMFPTIRFAAVLGQRAGILNKPDPAGALEISTSLHVRPQDCIIIGDSTMDLETANNAGMQAIAVTWGFHDRERLVAAGAELIADDPAGVLELVVHAP